MKAVLDLLVTLGNLSSPGRLSLEGSRQRQYCVAYGRVQGEAEES